MQYTVNTCTWGQIVGYIYTSGMLRIVGERACISVHIKLELT